MSTECCSGDQMNFLVSVFSQLLKKAKIAGAETDRKLETRSGRTYTDEYMEIEDAPFFNWLQLVLRDSHLE